MHVLHSNSEDIHEEDKPSDEVPKYKVVLCYAIAVLATVGVLGSIIYFGTEPIGDLKKSVTETFEELTN